MAHLAHWVFDFSWQASLLIALVLALRWILGRKLTPAWRCALWALVGIRLLFPGIVPLSPPSGGVASATPSPAVIPDASGLTVTVTKFWDHLAPIQPTPGQIAGSGSDQSAAPDSSRVLALLSWTWLTVTLLLLTRLLATNVRLARRLRRMTPVTDERILAAVRHCSTETRLARPLRVLSTSDLRTPAVTGLLHPALLLPSTCSLPDDDLRMVLLHELAHVRRRDVLAEYLTGLLTALHWFNPLVWIAASLCRADRELACDHAVLRRVGPDRRHDYGSCLLRALQSVANLPPEPAAVGALGGRTANLRRRLHLIASYPGTPSPAATLLGVAAFLAIGCAAATGPRPQAEPAPQPPSAAAAAEPPHLSPADTATHSLLDKELADVHFDAMPFDDVVDYLRTATGANIFVNWRALAAAGIERNAPVTAHLRGVRAAKVLDTVLRDIGGGTVRLRFTIDDGVIMISTADDLRENAVTRVYDIRDLLVEVPDFYSAHLNVRPGPPPATQPAPFGPEKSTREERVAQITSMIQSIVDPDSWRDAGGTVGSLRELNGQLIISQTPDNQAAVAQLLDTIRDGRAIQVTLESRYVFVDQKTLDDMGMDWANDPASKLTPTFLTDDKVSRFLRAAQNGKETTILTAPRVTLFNGQHAFVTTTNLTPYVQDFAVVHTKDGDTRYEPQMGTAEAGLTLDLSTTVSADRKSITTSVRSVMSALKGFKSRPFPGAPAGTQVQTPDLTQRTTETTASVPDGQTLLLIAMTPEAAEGTTRPKGQTFILIKPTILLQRPLAPHAPFPILPAPKP